MVFQPHDAYYKCDHCGHSESTYSYYGVTSKCSECGKPVIIQENVKRGPEKAPEIKY